MSGKAEINDITDNGNNNTSETLKFTEKDIIEALKSKNFTKLSEFYKNGWDVTVPIGPRQLNSLIFTSDVWDTEGAPELVEFLMKRGAVVDENIRINLVHMVSYGTEDHESFKLNKYIGILCSIIKFGQPDDDNTRILLKDIFKFVERMWSASTSEKEEFCDALLNAVAERDEINKITYIKPAKRFT